MSGNEQPDILHKKGVHCAGQTNLGGQGIFVLREEKISQRKITLHQM
ncbi:hypothetical protein JI735_31650 [Paenibacillus sonchi]|uniref:Uncharacterized protein n=1 Tax=Paenibacillus sonchi TaxID=373687 RepID=A0A974PBH8_9BACL|nr:hypothetical protein [Paenibacillus sonchi]QQZ60934.1 hypothetical protein JI735_31650 [Paenibacillus sonchi]